MKLVCKDVSLLMCIQASSCSLFMDQFWVSGAVMRLSFVFLMHNRVTEVHLEYNTYLQASSKPSTTVQLNLCKSMDLLSHSHTIKQQQSMT